MPKTVLNTVEALGQHTTSPNFDAPPNFAAPPNFITPNGAISSDRMAVVFAALSNAARIDILRYIASHQHCGCKDITQVLPLAQSTVSQHLKVLVEAGLITVESVPPRSLYQVNADLLKAMACTTSTFLDSCCDGSCR